MSFLSNVRDFTVTWTLKVAITDLGLRVMYSKTAQVVLVEDRVPPEALCLTWREPADLGSMCLPNQCDLIKPRGP